MSINISTAFIVNARIPNAITIGADCVVASAEYTVIENCALLDMTCAVGGNEISRNNQRYKERI